MKNRYYLLFSIFFLIAPIVFADITITTDQPIYNLGNKIEASASILPSTDFEGLFKLTLSCANYKLEYFLTPISLEQNFRTAINVPALTATEQMIGNCTMIGNLLTNDNQIIEEKESGSFSITNQLNVLPVKSTLTALPSELLQISGIVNDAVGKNVIKASVKIILDNSSYGVDVIDGKFNLTIEVPKNIRSGKHSIDINALDSKNNFGNAAIELEITAVPSNLELDLSETEVKPGSKILITSTLYDQGDAIINSSLDLELTSSKGNKIFRKIVQSNEEIDYEFSQYAEPGTYDLTSNYKNLAAQASINIKTVNDIKVVYANESVFIDNIGNVPFYDELTFILKSDLKDYRIRKKIDLEPGKMLAVDLSKEVPLGVYNVLLSLKEGIGIVLDELNEKAQSFVQENTSRLLQEKEKLLADNVMIHDNRPSYKRMATGFSSIAGFLAGADGLLARNPLLAPIILLAITLLIIFHYGIKPITRLFRGKKED